MRCTLLLALALTACGPGIRYTPAVAGDTSAARASDCALEVLTMPPTRSFVEIGTFDVMDHRLRAQSLDELLANLRAKACEVGADAILARRDGEGVYIGATALRWTTAASGDLPPTSTNDEEPPKR